MKNGKTAYEYAVDGGYTGTVQEFSTKLAQEYALKNHNHDSKYAAKEHSHDYAASDHNHDSAYAAKNHNHDENYAAKSHNHDTTYLKRSGGAVTGTLTVKGIILTEGVDYGKTPPKNPEVGRLFFIPVSEAVNL